jgi:hypothetical protein
MISVVREHLAGRDLITTMIVTHTLNRAGAAYGRSIKLGDDEGAAGESAILRGLRAYSRFEFCVFGRRSVAGKPVRWHRLSQ